MSKSDSGITYSFGAGNAIAAIISWLHWHSIGWAVVHSFFGWLYVVYYVIRISQ